MTPEPITHNQALATLVLWLAAVGEWLCAGTVVLGFIVVAYMTAVL